MDSVEVAAASAAVVVDSLPAVVAIGEVTVAEEEADTPRIRMPGCTPRSLDLRPRPRPREGWAADRTAIRLYHTGSGRAREAQQGVQG